MIAFVTIGTELIICAILKELAVEITPVVVSIMIGMFSIAFYYSVSTNETVSRFTTQIMLGYLFRIFLLYFDLLGRNIFPLPNGHSDADMFYVEALQYMHTGVTIRGVFPQVMGAFLSVFGTSRLFAQFVLMLFSMGAICIFAYALRELKIEEDASYFSMGLLCILPFFAMLSVAFMRESIVSFLVSLSGLSFVMWTTRKKEKYYFYSIVPVIITTAFHSGTIGIVIGLIVARVLYNNSDSGPNLRITNIIVALVMFLGLFYLYNNYGNVFFRKMTGVSSLEDIANVRDVANSSYVQYVGNSNSIGNIIIYTIPRMFYFLFSPLPWQWRGIGDIVTFFTSALFYLTVIISIGRYIFSEYDNSNRQRMIALVIILGITCFIFAWGVSNTGTASRHREKLVVLFSLALAITHNSRSNE